MSIRETVARLHALATGGATPAERATAEDILAKLRAKHGDAVLEEPEEPEEAFVDVRHRGRSATAVVGHVAAYLGLQAFYLMRGGRRVSGETRLRGPKALVDLAPSLVAQYTKKAERVAMLAETAYLLGAMPLPRSAESSSPCTITPEERELLMAAHRAGKDAAALPGLPETV